MINNIEGKDYSKSNVAVFTLDLTFGYSDVLKDIRYVFFKIMLLILTDLKRPRFVITFM